MGEGESGEAGEAGEGGGAQADDGVVAQVQLDKVGHPLETPPDHHVDAAVPHVDLLQVVQVSVPENILIDSKKIIERQI